MVAFVGKAIVKEHDLTSALFYVFFIVSIYDVKNDCLIGTELIEQKDAEIEKCKAAIGKLSDRYQKS